MRILLTSATLFALVVATPGISRAQDTEDAEILRMAKEHFRLGTDAFKAGKFPDAIKELKKAYLLKRLPPILRNIAATYEKLNDPDNAIYYYKKYLVEAAPEAKDRGEVKQLLADVQAKKNAPEVAEEAPEAPRPGRTTDREEAPPPVRASKPRRDAQAENNDPAEEAPPPTRNRPRRAAQAESPDEAPADEAPVRTSKPRRAAQAESPDEAPADEAPVRASKPRRAAQAENPDEAPAEETQPPVRATRPRRAAQASEEAPPEEAPRVVARPKKAAPVEEAEARPTRSASAASSSDWAHSPIDAAPPNAPVDVRVQSPVMKGVKVYLYYREAGSADFTSVLMKRHGVEKIGRIPADALSGKSIQYYIEAKDKTGNVVKASGTQVDPNIVMIDASAPTQVASIDGRHGDDEESASSDENAGEGQRKKAQPKRSSDEESALAPDEPPAVVKRPLRRRPVARDTRPSGPIFHTLGWIGLGLLGGGVAIGAGVGGAGFGLAAGRSSLVMTDGNSGQCNQLYTPPAKTPGNCYFNDPKFVAQSQPTDLDLQTQGHFYDTLGIIGASAGGVLALAGIALMVVDKVTHAAKSSSDGEPTNKTRRRSSPVKPAAPAPPAEESSIRNFMISPTVSPTTVGIGAGFNF